MQPPFDPNDSNPPDFVAPNPAIYTNNTPFPSNSLLSFQTVQYREYTYVSISFCPFSYKPLDQEVSLLNQININVNCSTDTSIKEYKLRPYTQIDKRAYKNIQNIVANNNDIDNLYPITKSKLTVYNTKSQGVQHAKAFDPTDLPALAGSAVQYVIITNNTDVYGNAIVDENDQTFLTNKFQEFADWKTKNGTPAKVVTLDDIRSNYQGGDIPEQIREFIKDAVKLWNTEYILIGGTASIIPVRLTLSSIDPIMATDLYYAAISGNNWNANANAAFGESVDDLCDFTPDIAVGRAPIDTHAEMDVFLEKNYTYTRSNKVNDIQDAFIPNGDFLNQQLNIGGVVYQHAWPTSDPLWLTSLALPTFWYIETEFSDDSDQYTMLEYKENWSDLPPSNTWAPAYDPSVGGDIMDEKIYSGGADHDRVLEKMNEKPGFIFHIDHSGPHNIGLTERFHSTYGINDQDIYNNLETTTHQYPILMGGGCNTAPIDMKYYIGSDWLNAKGGGVAYLGAAKDVRTYTSYSFSQRFFDVLYEDTNTLFLGDIKNEASYLANINEGGAYFWHHRMYQLLGDPELLVYTDNPDNNPLTVTVTPNINTLLTTGNQEISVKVEWADYTEDTATICLYKDNEVLAIQKGAIKGTTYPFNITPDTTGDISITVIRHNANPYEETISVNNYTSGVHLYKSDITIYDTLTGSNIIEVIQPGQTVYLSIELTNTGETTATPSNGELFTNGVSIGNSDFPTIAKDQSKESIERYMFTAPINLEYGSEIDFVLEIDQNGTAFTEPFILNTKLAKLDIGDRFMTKENGNIVETAIFTAGEEIDLTIDIHNYSNIEAKSVNAVLSSNTNSNVSVTFNTDNQNYGNIVGFLDPTISKTFTFTLNQNCTATDNLIFDLELTDFFGNTQVFEINLSEPLPDKIEAFDFITKEQAISLKWRNAHLNPTTEEWEVFENIKGNNVYRNNDGTWVKINDYLLTSPVFYDNDCLAKTNYEYKISVVSETGNESNMASLDTHHAWTSLPLSNPFPQIASTTVANYSKGAIPTVCDVNGNDNKEIVALFKQNQTSRLMAFKQDGTELYDVNASESDPTGFDEIPGRSITKQAIGNIDNQGNMELITIGEGNKIYGHRLQTNPEPLWTTPLSEIGRFETPPVLADLNNDGNLEIIVMNNLQQSGVGNNIPDIYVFNKDKELVWSENVPPKPPIGDDDYYGLSMGQPAIADMNGDGLLDIVVGFARNINGRGVLYLFENTTTNPLDNPSFNTIQLHEFALHERADSAIILNDIDGDNEYEILLSTLQTQRFQVYAFEANGDLISNYVFDNDGSTSFTNISVADINFDGFKKVFFNKFESTNSGYSTDFRQNQKLVILDPISNSISMTVDVKDYVASKSNHSPLLADIDGDPDMEIIVNVDGVLYAFDPDGDECPFWRLGTGDELNKIEGSPFIGDIDNDGINEVIAIANNCETYVWKTTGNAGRIAWGSQRANPQNTGVAPLLCELTGAPIEITNTTTWNSDQNILGNLILKNNSELTVTNATLSFAQNSKLIIEAGSKLILEGGGSGLENPIILKSACDTHWKGIIVEGNSTQPQTESNQGVLEINGNVTIQDAEIAIYVGNSTTLMNKGIGPVYPWNNKAGGIIKIDGGTNKTVNFINNISGIEFPSYRDGTQDNVSYIKNTIFKTTTDYNHLENPDAFISLWGVNKITIEGNVFRNETLIQNYPNSNIDKAGKGIVTTDAALIIKPNTNDANSYNHFENLQYAIFAQGTGSSNDIEIKENSFLTNYNNIRIENIDNVQIIDNDIEVFLSTGVYFPSIYLKNSDDFIFEENNIHGPTTYNLQAIDESGANSGPYGMGVWFDNCHASNELYRNNFTQLFNAIMITGIETKEYDDKSAIVNNGLKIICNTFDDVKSDIYIEPASFINPNQGSTTKDAGNIFNPDTLGGFEFFSRDAQITYHHRNEVLYIPEDIYNVNLSYTSTSINHDCLSKIGEFVRDEDISQIDNEINQRQADLEALTDGGDTEALNETVDEAENNEALNLRNELLSKSPSLSDTIMVSTTAIEDVLPALMVKQVLAANPKAAKSDKVQTALDNRTNQLPEYMRAEIDLGKNILSYKEALESVLSQAIYERENLVNRRIIQLKKEGSSASLDSLETLLVTEANNTLNRNYQLVNFYLSQDNTQEAQNVFTAIPTNFSLTSVEQNKYDKLNQLYSIRFNLENANKSWFEMSGSEKGVVETLAIDSTSTAGMQARSILSLVNHIDYNLYMPIIDTSNNQTNSYHGAPEMLFKAYPEVATDYFIIEYVLGENENPEEVTMAVFDDKGNQVKSFEVINHENQFLIECENWKEGVYWCRKSVGKRVTEQEKIIINKGGIVIDSVEASSVKGTNSLVLFPNPTSGYLFVSFKAENNTKTNIQITDTKGILIAEYKLKNNLTQIATDKWQQGVYIVNIIANNKIVDTAKIIVE